MSPGAIRANGNDNFTTRSNGIVKVFFLNMNKQVSRSVQEKEEFLLELTERMASLQTSPPQDK